LDAIKAELITTLQNQLCITLMVDGPPYLLPEDDAKAIIKELALEEKQKGRIPRECITPLLVYLLISPCVEDGMMLDRDSVKLIVQAWRDELDELRVILQDEGPASYGVFNAMRDPSGPRDASPAQIANNVGFLLRHQVGFLCSIDASVRYAQLLVSLSDDISGLRHYQPSCILLLDSAHCFRYGQGAGSEVHLEVPGAILLDHLHRRRNRGTSHYHLFSAPLIIKSSYI
jgi:hypothetical protein